MNGNQSIPESSHAKCQANLPKISALAIFKIKCADGSPILDPTDMYSICKIHVNTEYKLPTSQLVSWIGLPSTVC